LGKDGIVPHESDAGPSAEFPEARTPAERIAEAVALRFRRVPWDPSEIVPAAVVTAVLLSAVAEIAAAIVIGVSGQGFGVAESLLQATDWAQPVLVAVLLGSVLLSWKEVSTRCDDLDFFSSTDDDLAASEIDPDETMVRLFRSRFLASSALVAAGSSAAAAIGFEVGVAMERLQRPIGLGGFDGQTWGALIQGGGVALAVGVLAFACLVIGRRIHRRARATLALPESELADHD